MEAFKQVRRIARETFDEEFSRLAEDKADLIRKVAYDTTKNFYADMVKVIGGEKPPAILQTTWQDLTVKWQDTKLNHFGKHEFPSSGLNSFYLGISAPKKTSLRQALAKSSSQDDFGVPVVTLIHHKRGGFTIRADLFPNIRTVTWRQVLDAMSIPDANKRSLRYNRNKRPFIIPYMRYLVNVKFQRNLKRILR